METQMSRKVVIGVYDSLGRAEAAELLLGDVHLPVGQEFLVAADMEAGNFQGNITAREVAETLADAGVPLAQEEIVGYEEALKAGKVLLIFHGNEKMVTKAYDTLGNTDQEGLTLLGG